MIFMLVCSYAVVIQKSFPLLLDCQQFFKNFSIFRDRNTKVSNEYDWAGVGNVVDYKITIKNQSTEFFGRFVPIFSLSYDSF